MCKYWLDGLKWRIEKKCKIKMEPGMGTEKVVGCCMHVSDSPSVETTECTILSGWRHGIAGCVGKEHCWSGYFWCMECANEGAIFPDQRNGHGNLFTVKVQQKIKFVENIRFRPPGS